LKNLTLPAILGKRIDFSGVTGGPRRARPSRRALSLRNLLVGEIPPEAGRRQNSPINKLLKRLSPDPWIGKLRKSPSSLKNVGYAKLIGSPAPLMSLPCKDLTSTYASRVARQNRINVAAPKTMFGIHMATTGFNVPVSPKLSAADSRI
jgi:hypothetical protein